MKLLLDTHALIWWWRQDGKLSKAAVDAIDTSRNSMFVSAASAWEIATKVRLRKLELEAETARLEQRIRDDGLVPLAIEMRHGIRAGSYDLPHRDPFDRMIAAQAELDNLTLVSADPVFDAFPCRTLW